MNNVATTELRRKKRKSRSLDRQKAKKGWIFVAPFAIGFIAIYAPIVFNSLKCSFFRMTGGELTKFVGFKNYSYALFEDPNFLQIFTGSLKQLVLDIPAIVIFSLFIAILLNQKMKGRAAFRAIFFIPVIVSTGIIESIDLGNSIVNAMGSASTIDTGGGNTWSAGSQVISQLDVQRFFSSMQVGTELVMYVTNVVNNVYNVINRSGVQMLVFLAGLQSISPAIYESCYMEGASSWETFWKITFPMISPMILVNAIYTVIDSFTTASNSVMSHISGVYESVTFGQERSTAMAWMYFLAVVLIISAVAGILSAYVFYQRRD